MCGGGVDDFVVVVDVDHDCWITGIVGCDGNEDGVSDEDKFWGWDDYHKMGSRG